MVIGFDGSRAFQKERTGTENYSYQLLKALAKIDTLNHYKVYLRLSASQVFDLLESERPRSRRPEGSDRRGVPLQGWWPDNFQFQEISWPRLWTQGGLALQTFKDCLDVLFVPAHTLPLIRKPDLKTVVTVHDLGSEYLPSAHQFKQRLYLGFMQKFQLKTASKIIAVSKATKKDLVKRLGIDEAKITVIYEGFDRELFKPAANDVLVNTLSHYNLQPKTYYLFVGTVQPRKNLERLIKAFALYSRSLTGTCQSNSPPPAKGGEPARSASRTSKLVRFGASRLAQTVTDWRTSFAPLLVIAGTKGWLADEIYRLPRKLGIEDRVKFLGYVPGEDLPALYSGAIALVFPSLFEGFGLPILEAQACGCPVITSDVSSMPEVAGSTSLKLRGVKDGAVFVNPYSIDGIVEGMEKCQMSNVKCQMIKAGTENIKRFSWEKCAKETLTVLEKTAKS